MFPKGKEIIKGFNEYSTIIHTKYYMNRLIIYNKYQMPKYNIKFSCIIYQEYHRLCRIYHEYQSIIYHEYQISKHNIP